MEFRCTRLLHRKTNAERKLRRSGRFVRWRFKAGGRSSLRSSASVASSLPRVRSTASALIVQFERPIMTICTLTTRRHGPSAPHTCILVFLPGPARFSGLHVEHRIVYHALLSGLGSQWPTCPGSTNKTWSKNKIIVEVQYTDMAQNSHENWMRQQKM
ncbi:hypothetical protein BD769DRAFT_72099 [Suillus cothurnatus]|nr:hypothetical protein BD769DRAFT_72099 [Suillus cothurnatus]